MRTTTLTSDEILDKLRSYRKRYYSEKYKNNEEFKNKLKDRAKQYYNDNKERIKSDKKIKYLNKKLDKLNTDSPIPESENED